LQKISSFEIISIFTEKYTKKDFSVQENGAGFTHYLHFVRFFGEFSLQGSPLGLN